MAVVLENNLIQIHESGMIFGDFDHDDCFAIEEDPFYKSLKSDNFKSVEFVLCRTRDDDCKLLFVEAKSKLNHGSFTMQFHDEIKKISQKFMDSLQIICGIWHGGHKNEVQLPSGFACFYEGGKGIEFVLVFKDCNSEQLLTISDAITRELRKEIKLWKFKVSAPNEEFAKNKELVVANNPA